MSLIEFFNGWNDDIDDDDEFLFSNEGDLVNDDVLVLLFKLTCSGLLKLAESFDLFNKLSYVKSGGLFGNGLSNDSRFSISAAVISSFLL